MKKIDVKQQLYSIVDFKGRSSRRQYIISRLASLLILLPFYFVVIIFITYIPKNNISSDASEVIGGLGIVVFWVTGVSVTVRRFHDSGESGWLYLGLFVPIINIFLYWIIFFTKSDAGENRFGKNPHVKSDLEDVFN